MKNILYYAILAIVYAVDPYVMFDASYHILKPKYNKKVYYILAFIGFYGIIVLKQIMIFAGNKIVPMLTFPCMFAYIMLMGYFLFQRSLKDKIVLFIELYVMSCVIDSIVGVFVIGVFHMPADVLTSRELPNIVTSAVSRGINLFIYKALFFKIKSKDCKCKIENKYLVLAISNFILVVGIIIIFYAIQGLTNFNNLLASLSGIFLIFEIVFFMLVAIESSKDKHKIEQHAAEQLRLLKAQVEYADSITEMTQEMRKLRHDFHNHLSTITQLLENSQIECAINYIKQLNCVVEDAMDVCVIDNPILRALVTEKKRKARRKHIPFATLISVSIFPLSDMELNSLLSNIFDNAIEANERLVEKEKRKIDLEITRDTGNIYIECANALEKKPVSDPKSGILTSKENKSVHGLGLKIVEDIVRKYNGSMNIFYNDNIFKMSISLPYCEETE